MQPANAKKTDGDIPVAEEEESKGAARMFTIDMIN